MRKLLLLLLCTGFMACENESIEQMETAISEDVNLRKGTQFSVCHKNDVEIVISESAVAIHVEHGDAVDMDGDGYYDKENPCSEIDLDDTIPFDQSTLVDADGDGYFTIENPFSEIDCDDTAFSEINSCVKTPITNTNIHGAVIGWIYDQPAAEAIYGHIKDWDVSGVKDMSYLFYEAINFNDDISKWDVSSVTSMSFMFYRARRFNGDLSSWDVSSVTNMEAMFYYTYAFNQDLSAWDVSSVTQCQSFSVGATNWASVNKPILTCIQ